ncbi:peptide-methionine (R)-S-oxide reductase MsrB [Collimonas pratensis]|uniref:peptide-methionine (R)-S-oxide reductase MsrB n=1 Tax=Collimonas pratensis TaxID=279113 RepID=UPI00143DC364|nr:peptide-methionine (R)-S-oxide reductase MsrB [Collimonas pratensis]NKI72562.1 peptide-methionine (R)-S-oxide reductase MsrB [Collimonas pratensis]
MKTTRRTFLGAGLFAGLSVGLGSLVAATSRATVAEPAEHFEVMHSDAEWRSLLGASSYAVLRQEATERPYSSPLNEQHGAGVFSCAGCARPLFSSSTKFDSHTGWPSFWRPLENAVLTREDRTFGMLRKEVHCQRCGGHLGHVFDDGPKPTGLRYCMNGIAMNFTAATT